MTQDLFSIDGTYFNVFIPEKGIKRSFSVSDSDKAGRVLTGRMVRDIIGTFYNYTIQLDTSKLSSTEYDALYEILSEPKDCHTITVPYGQRTITFDAYCTSGEDTLSKRHNNTNEWSGLSVNFIAMEPQRT